MFCNFFREKLFLKVEEKEYIWSKHIYGTIAAGKYCVWSIHTFLFKEDEETQTFGEDFYGEIISDNGSILLGHVYFKPGQWACSYGMKLIDPDFADSLNMRLAFCTADKAREVRFAIADYQIVMFDDLALASAYANGREFVTSVSNIH